MKIFIKSNDVISIKNNCIEVIAENKNYSFDKTEIKDILLLTRDSGPFDDDVCLAIIINSTSISEEVIIFIESEHQMYEKFLFDELKEIVSIDYEAIIQAMTCVEDKVFVLYKK